MSDEKCIVRTCPMSRIRYEPYCPAHAKKYGAELPSVKIEIS